MIKFSWICIECNNKHYPCKMSFTGHNNVYPHEMSDVKRKHCISPFHQDGDEHKANWVQVKP